MRFSRTRPTSKRGVKASTGHVTIGRTFVGPGKGGRARVGAPHELLTSFRGSAPSGSEAIFSPVNWPPRRAQGERREAKASVRAPNAEAGANLAPPNEARKPLASMEARRQDLLLRLAPLLTLSRLAEWHVVCLSSGAKMVASRHEPLEPPAASRLAPFVLARARRFV